MGYLWCINIFFQPKNKLIMFLSPFGMLVLFLCAYYVNSLSSLAFRPTYKYG